MDSSLENFIQDISGDQYFRVEDDLGNGFVRLKAAEAQRRQAKQDIRSTEDIIIELLRNSRDAHARAIFVATWTEGSTRYLTVLDDGDGIPGSMHEIVFEPFVTSKLDSFHSDKWGVHGRGMALYSIKQNTSSAQIIDSDINLGAVFHIESNTALLPEKRDQSSYPIITKDKNGKSVLRGPHNIIRTVMEFAIEERSRISVYLGSPASIVSTLYYLGSTAASNFLSIFSGWDETTPIIQRFAYADDPNSLAELANSLSLPISVRTAHRIMRKEIEPLPVHVSYLAQNSSHKTKSINKGETKSQKIGTSHPRSIKIAKADLNSFSTTIQNACKDLANSYYLDISSEPTISFKNNELTIKVQLQERDHNPK